MFELHSAGYVIGGPKSARFVENSDEITPMIEAMADEEGYDRDDYTATEVFHIGWRGTAASMPSTWPKKFELIPKE